MKFPVNKDRKYFIVLADEIFLQLNQPDWVPDRVFSQNRAAIGVEIPVNQSVSYEMGYLNQFNVGSPDQMSHVVYFTVNVNVD